MSILKMGRNVLPKMSAAPMDHYYGIPAVSCDILKDIPP